MNLPSDFIDYIKPLLDNEWDSFEKALKDTPPVSIRVNKEKLKLAGDLPLSNVPWCESGYYLERRPQFTFDPLFHAGCYYVQEASSMFVAQVMDQYIDGNVKVLDLCAAPGGKSTLIVDKLSIESLLVSNEVIRSRANILSENITKWGSPNVVVTSNDPSDFGRLKHFFDFVLIDAPCSGEGMFRKDHSAIAEWSAANVSLCQERQQRIVADVWDSLKPGGILLYSTCTYNVNENEENVQWIVDNLGAEVLPINIQEEWGITSSKKGQLPVYRFFPHKTKGEGFFLAVLRKNEEEYLSVNRRKNKTKLKLSIPKDIKDVITSSNDFDFILTTVFWHAVSKSLADDVRYLLSQLNVLYYGICLGEVKGKDFIPNQSLAMSQYLNPDIFPICEVDWTTAVSFLRREPLALNDHPKGYILLLYCGYPLGFVKNIGNRANNLYPQEWRIRSANVPDIVQIIKYTETKKPI